MTKASNNGEAVQKLLWGAIAERGAGMLSLTKSGLHAQPMLAIAERRCNRLWFVARRDSELAREIGDGGCCAFVYQDGDLMASISGALHLAEDRHRLARYWSAKVAAWAPEGPKDPRLTLLRMDCVDAEVWLAGFGLSKFVWEIAGPGGRPQPLLDLADRAHATLH
ncbi:pyridoxamine 5'-phosphate oxidase family protein [Phenylobacterium sp.]|uniref:pyridoxamine 5'-phosphate oxidase family protein n=1 Tax=Phenylobacterium sp. TaxID=1871053 RepID=UPI0011FA5FA1|nr:pyridoxamine 5'-phosphate oxidase family protein [Phenylobacterium sp.]THD64714.1 MAG: hypothetical protein E8A49_01315 [Phenylobacterium sp.]